MSDLHPDEIRIRSLFACTWRQGERDDRIMNNNESNKLFFNIQDK